MYIAYQKITLGDTVFIIFYKSELEHIDLTHVVA